MSDHVPFDNILGGVPRRYLDYLEDCRRRRAIDEAALIDQMEALDQQMDELLRGLSDQERADIAYRVALRLPADLLPQE